MPWYDPILKNFDHKIKKDEIILRVCPECRNDRYNCEISMTKKVWSCWACGARGSGKWFLMKNHLPYDEDLWVSTRPEAGTKSIPPLDMGAFSKVEYNHFKTFLSSKGLSEQDVTDYSILCQEKMIVIPLYEGTKCVYYIRRDTASGRYFNPQIPKGGLLPYYVGRLGCDVVYLVEGTFDAISLHKLGFTSAVLLGTHMTADQMAKLRAFGFKKVVVCLDGDVYKKALELQQTLQCDGFDSYIVKFEGKDDPNDVYVSNPMRLIELLKGYHKPTLLDKVLARI